MKIVVELLARQRVKQTSPEWKDKNEKNNNWMDILKDIKKG